MDRLQNQSLSSVTLVPVRKRWRWVSLVVAVLFISWLAYGPLFAWSPLTPGFHASGTPHATILFRDPPGLRVSAGDVESHLLRLQTDIGLEFTAPARFLLCDTWSDFGRFTPWLRVSQGVGAITLPIGVLTYVTPVVRNRDDLIDFLVHEAAHALLYQHASIRNRLELERQAWFVEGVGVHFGNPDAYGTWDEFVRTASTTDLIMTIDPSANANHRGSGGFRFSYAAYGYFVGYLVDHFGADRFHDFARLHVDQPTEYRDQFQRIFGVTLQDAIRALASLPSEPHRARKDDAANSRARRALN